MKAMFADSSAEGAKIDLVIVAIRTISKPLYHGEWVFSDGMSWSSEFGIGPRFKKIGYSHPERWIEQNHWWITPAQEAVMRYKAELWCKLREAGFSKYDITGAGGCLFTGNEHPWDPYCTEGMYEIYPDEHKIACLNHKMFPQRLYEVGEAIKTIKEREREI